MPVSSSAKKNEDYNALPGAPPSPVFKAQQKAKQDYDARMAAVMGKQVRMRRQNKYADLNARTPVAPLTISFPVSSMNFDPQNDPLLPQQGHRGPHASLRSMPTSVLADAPTLNTMGAKTSVTTSNGTTINYQP